MNEKALKKIHALCVSAFTDPSADAKLNLIKAHRILAKEDNTLPMHEHFEFNAKEFRRLCKGQNKLNAYSPLWAEFLWRIAELIAGTESMKEYERYSKRYSGIGCSWLSNRITSILWRYNELLDEKECRRKEAVVRV